MVGLGFMGLGSTEVLILLLAAAFLFMGSKKLPELAKGLGRAIGEFQKGRLDVEKEFGRTGLTGDADDDDDADDARAIARLDDAPVRRVRRLKAGALGPPAGSARTSNLVLAARALGIETGGKTDEELRREIARYAGAQPKNDGTR